MERDLRVLIIAGPNGAGKTTFARRLAVGPDNFEHLYTPLVDAWALYDNSGNKPVLLGWKEKP